VTVDLAAYRVVQESLTNTMRHAGAGAAARVSVSYAPDTLVLVVTDTGHGPAGRGDGRGLVGMRERVELLGGGLCCAAAATGGFEVRATLPLGGAR
jgi:signal transduction histidine kinase